MLTESAADGWVTRRTVVGGPDSWVRVTEKVKFRSPAVGCDIPPAYRTDTLCDGQGGGGGGGGSGRVRYRVSPAAPTTAAAVTATAVRRCRSRRGSSRTWGGVAVSWP
ncbi:hypothetical protein AB0B50_23440 [Streptomyces sp. NPDC041068]|uniref:hypothetical protein n=1 Tax=Streptomyces sp. NPDC041068 TaxID=3155130 RepID=UPI0033EA6D2E